MNEAIKTRPYWISWYWPLSAGSFELWSPWWITGERMDGARTVCAAIIARSQEDAKSRVRESFDKPPHGLTWRFVERKEATWSPFCSRFPRADWMHWSTDPKPEKPE